MIRNDLAYYDRHADQWWQTGGTLNLLNHLNPGRFQFFDQYVADWRGLNVLDVGCGGGLTCEFLARRGAVVTGVDRSPRSIATAQAHAQSQGLTINYQEGTGEALPFEARQFQAVVCVDVLEHVQDVGQVVRECGRVLQPGGIFLFDTINRTWKSKVMMIWLMEDILRQIPQGIHDWEKFITPTELTTFLEQAGFSDILCRGFDLTDGGNLKTLFSLLLSGLQSDDMRKALKVQINDDTSVVYIGKAVKSGL